MSTTQKDLIYMRGLKNTPGPHGWPDLLLFLAMAIILLVINHGCH
jgi:hypothetical protein